ncbi:hypothetical protein [Staphylococcus hominis]|uniref:hypothetical protein n=1 Tax=Staphylococcus hominis TaxID=1290 RepID=UPI002303A2A8|nr:hypothetical protein [Staphylococcus hominis]
MKKLLGTLFAATLVLSACSQDDTKEDENKKSESTTKKKADDKEDKKSKEEKKSQENEDNKSTQEDNSTEEPNTQETATNEQVQSQQQTQETATQEQQQTQQANNNQQNEQRYDYDHNGVYRTPAEQRAHEQWINDQNEWNDEQQQASQNNHVDLNSLPATDFQTDWMSESGQEQVNDLVEQKDSGQISQYEFNDRVSDVMNNEMDNQ